MFPVLPNLAPLLLILLAFILRFPSFFEPYWYGDELIRLVVGQEWLSGTALYSEIFDNSPPLIYLIFGLAQNLFILKIISFIFSILAILAFYNLAQFFSKTQKLPKFYPIVTSAVFTLLISTPIFEGNIATAEIFILAPTISAMYLITTNYQNQKLTPFVLAGILFTTATLVRIQAVADLATSSVFLLFKKGIKPFLAQLQVFVTIWVFTFLVFSLAGNFKNLISSVFFGNFDYVNYSNDLVIPFGLIIVKLAALILALLILAKLKNFFSEFEFLIFIWLVFSFFAASLSGRGFPHYLLQITPPASLILGLILRKKMADFFKIGIVISVFLIFFILGKFYIPRTFSYYLNFGKLLTNLITEKEARFENYKNWFDQRVIQSETIANYIASKLEGSDKILVLGNSPEIYLLSKKSVAGNYVVSYHLNFQKSAKDKTLKVLTLGKAKIVVVFPEGIAELPEATKILPKNYFPTLIISKGQIWERRF